MKNLLSAQDLLHFDNCIGGISYSALLSSDSHDLEKQNSSIKPSNHHMPKQHTNACTQLLLKTLSIMQYRDNTIYIIQTPFILFTRLEICCVVMNLSYFTLTDFKGSLFLVLMRELYNDLI